jgi:polyhydroxybutyrate depolymerase
MNRTRLRTLFFVGSGIFLSGAMLVWFSLTMIAQAQQRRATGERHSFSHEGEERAYRIHVPEKIADSDGKIPLVICFHGGGGNAEIASRMGWTPLADEEGFIVVYPEGLNRHWNDGRLSKKFAEQDAKTNDVAFVLALLEKLKNEHPIDPDRVFVSGASNGGFFSQRMAIEAADQVAAAGVIIATMPKPFIDGSKPAEPSRPVSVLIMNGTADPFVPYEGGPITPNFFPNLRRGKDRDYGRGECSSTDDAVDFWLRRNGLEKTEPEKTVLPDKAPKDGCKVEKTVWTGGKAGTSVVLYKVIGGGHTIPGGAQYLGEKIIGKTCRDFDGIRAVWKFFKAHPRQRQGPADP